MTIPPCHHCGGRIMLDTLEDEWLCLHCARRWPRTPREPLPYVPGHRIDRAGKHAASTPNDATSAKSCGETVPKCPAHGHRRSRGSQRVIGALAQPHRQMCRRYQDERFGG